MRKNTYERVAQLNAIMSRPTYSITFILKIISDLGIYLPKSTWFLDFKANAYLMALLFTEQKMDITN